MLYDPKWEIKADPFSFDNLVAWLEKQPSDKEYDWAAAGSCLLGQWCESNGLSGEDLFNKSIELGNWTGVANNKFADVALGNLSECTFGAALERAREVSRT